VDYRKALYWYEKAAAQGHTGAMFNCGVFYFNGNGVARDKAKAKGYFQKAASLGHDGAKNILSKYY
jgi:hypothetical protein